LIVKMGCEISTSRRTKREFTQQTNEINKFIESISVQQNSLKDSISSSSFVTTPVESIEDMRKSLIPHLEKIESLIIELRESKGSWASCGRLRDNSDTVLKQKLQVSTKAENTEQHSPMVKNERKEEVSILDDPAIKAMIEKNRQKFIAKKK
jgi:exonuclease VII small subunit